MVSEVILTDFYDLINCSNCQNSSCIYRNNGGDTPEWEVNPEKPEITCLSAIFYSEDEV